MQQTLANTNVEKSSFDRFLDDQESEWTLTYIAAYLLINTFTRVVVSAAKTHPAYTSISNAVMVFGALSVFDPMVPVFAEVPSPLMVTTSLIHTLFFKPLKHTPEDIQKDMNNINRLLPI